MLNDLYLPVNVAGIEFKNPFYVASGPTTNSVKQLKRIEETGWAGASIKLTIDPAPYINRVPRYALFKDRNALAFTAEKRLTFEEGLRLVDDDKSRLCCCR
jgi:dihydroorotate dehydrogenase